MPAEETIRSMLQILDREFPPERAKSLYRMCKLDRIKDGCLQGTQTAETLHRIVFDRLRRESCLTVLEELCRRCDRRVLAVKGAFYATDLYPDPEWRTFGDLDLITLPEYAADVLYTLENTGFLLPYSHEDCMRQLRTEHVVLKSQGKILPLEVELHISAWNPVTVYKKYVKSLFTRAVWNADKGILIPDPADRVIHSLIHFWIHLRDYLLESYIAEESIPLNLRDLLDAALTVEKYSSDITPEIIAERTEEMSGQLDMSGALAIFRLLFPYSPLSAVKIPVQGSSVIFQECEFLAERLLHISSVTDLFSTRLQELTRFRPEDIFAEKEISGKSLESDGISVIVYLRSGNVCVNAKMCTDPVCVVGTRLKLYYVAAGENSFAIRMTVFRLTLDGVTVESNGVLSKASVLDWEQTGERQWRINVSVSADDMYSSDGLLFMNPVLEYSVITQKCIFGDRWNELARWRPIRPCTDDFSPS